MPQVTTPRPSVPCPVCGDPTLPAVLSEAAWLPATALVRLAGAHPGWARDDGSCPACAQDALLAVLLHHGHNAFHASIQEQWPIDAESAFGAIPTPLRLHADPRFTGRGVTMAFVDAGFYPHPDLVDPINRIRAWVDASNPAIDSREFGPADRPQWPGWDRQAAAQWHGLMTTAAACGNGALSHGFYRGLAPDARLLLVQVADASGHIGNAAIARALAWIAGNAERLDVRVVNLSLGGDPVAVPGDNEVDAAVAALVDRGIAVVAAAGNEGERRLVPPASAAAAITVGGLDDRNTFAHDAWEVWHSNYGETHGRVPKPEVVAPSLHVVAPILPDSPLATEARGLFARRGATDAEEALALRKLVTPHYQHVEGTSVAAPLVAAIVACMLEANRALTPRRVRELLQAAARHVPGASVDRQGAGAVDAGRAVTMALADRHSPQANFAVTPVFEGGSVRFLLHDHSASHVAVLGSWDGWRSPGLLATRLEDGLWQARLTPVPSGVHTYKFLLDGTRWLVDPANPTRVTDEGGRWNSLLDSAGRMQTRCAPPFPASNEGSR